MWREGVWLDLWSVVHVLTGVLLGLGWYIVNVRMAQIGAPTAAMITFVLLVVYEYFEFAVDIQEAITNRYADVIVGMAGYFLAFEVLAPSLSETYIVLTFVVVCLLTVTVSTVGWRASQKAAALQTRVRVRYAADRARLKERSARFRGHFRRR
jgi:hypothetical protein